METGMIKWERENIEAVRHSTSNKKDMIWIAATTKGKPYNKLSISANLVKDAGFKAGDTVWLYKCGSLFMLRKEPSDFVLRYTNGNKDSNDTGNAKILELTSQNFVGHLNWAITGATEYDAWVDGNDILFKARGVK